ncbi:hypothetical protein GGR58DRAFT_474453 [Xylaria digitata]|nr:hypothetical protein GGR58DRAFT_474453 [Xylaria digitata]
MSTANRHTLFLNNALSDGELELDVPKPAPPHPKTNRTLQQQRIIGQEANANMGSTKTKPVSTSRRFPVNHINHSNKVSLIPVLTGSPWSHYKRRYRVRYGYSFGVITSRNASCQSFMIRTISGRDAKERIQKTRQLCHPNLTKNIEIYGSLDSSYFLISEFMPTTLLHLCRSPTYPTKPQLSSILHQSPPVLNSSLAAAWFMNSYRVLTFS